MYSFSAVCNSLITSSKSSPETRNLFIASISDEPDFMCLSSSTYLALKETGSVSGGKDGSSNPYLFGYCPYLFPQY